MDFSWGKERKGSESINLVENGMGVCVEGGVEVDFVTYP